MNGRPTKSVLRSWAVILAVGIAACSGSSRVVLPVFHAGVTVPAMDTRAYQGVSVDVAAFEHVSEGLEPRHVGSARTGVSKRVASVRMSEDPAELVRRTIAGALARAGIDVDAAGPADYRLSGRIRKFWVEERKHEKTFETTVARVRFSAALTDARGEVSWSGELSAEAESYPAIDATEDQKQMLEEAVAEAVQAMLDDRRLWLALSGAGNVP